jgi:hypothetical protein
VPEVHDLFGLNWWRAKSLEFHPPLDDQERFDFHGSDGFASYVQDLCDFIHLNTLALPTAREAADLCDVDVTGMDKLVDVSIFQQQPALIDDKSKMMATAVPRTRPNRVEAAG